MTVDIEAVRRYWNEHPLSAAEIPHPLNTPEYFEFYDKLREQNESVEFSAALHEYAQFRGKRVLDVGCGNGYVLSRYAREGAHVFGIDLTQTAVDLTRGRFELMSLSGDFRVASVESLPFDDDSFDCVCSMGVIHHTPDTPRAVEEIFRVLRPGGRLILMVYHRNSALYRLRFPLLRLRTGRSTQQLVNEIDGVGNPKGEVYTRSSFRRLLTRFEEVELCAGCLQPWMLPPGLSSVAPERALRPLAGRFGWFLYAKARKPR
jgi:SAM-dependent methyltransferase